MRSLLNPRFHTIIETRLIHRCTISAMVPSTTSSLGKPKPTWPVGVPNNHCLFEGNSPVLQLTERGNLTVREATLFLMGSLNIEQGAKISNIKDMNGDFVIDGEFLVDTVSKDNLGEMYLTLAKLKRPE